MNLIQHEHFQTIAGYAKAVAIATGKSDLSGLAFLQGALIAHKNNRLTAELGDDLSNKQATIETLAAAQGLPLDVASPLTDRSLPLDPEFKAMLGKYMASDVPEFLRALIASLPEGNGPTLSPAPSQPLAQEPATHPLLDSVAFQTIKTYAKLLAGHYGLGTLTPALLTASAWAARRAGELDKEHALATHLDAHVGDIERILKAQGWTDLRLDQPAAPDEALRLELDAEMKQAIAAKAGEPNPVLELVRWSVYETGTRLRQQEHVAYHEAAHAVLSMVLRPDYRIRKVSIVSEGNAAGRTAFSAANLPTTWESIWEDLCVSLAGRYAEIRQFGRDSMDDGASSDLAGATESAWRAIAMLGMDPELGPVQLDVLKKVGGISGGWLFDLAQQRLHAIMKESEAKTEALVEAHWPAIEKLAHLLLKQQSVNEDEIRTVIQIASA